MLKNPTKTVKARIVKGHIVPAEDLGLREGDELEVTATIPAAEAGASSSLSSIEATAGAWRDQLDCAAFEEDVYQSRLTANRPAVVL